MQEDQRINSFVVTIEGLETKNKCKSRRDKAEGTLLYIDLENTSMGLLRRYKALICRHC